MGHSCEFLSSKVKGLRYSWGGSNMFFFSIHIRVLHKLEQLGHLHWSKFLELNCLTTSISLSICLSIYLSFFLYLSIFYGCVFVLFTGHMWGVREQLMGGKILWKSLPLPCRFPGITFKSLLPGQKLFYLLSSCNKGNKCEIIWILCLFGISSRRMRKILTANNSWPRM